MNVVGKFLLINFKGGISVKEVTNQFLNDKNPIMIRFQGPGCLKFDIIKNCEITIIWQSVFLYCIKHTDFTKYTLYSVIEKKRHNKKIACTRT